MTVAELVAGLEQLDPSLEVYYDDPYCGWKHITLDLTYDDLVLITVTA